MAPRTRAHTRARLHHLPPALLLSILIHASLSSAQSTLTFTSATPTTFLVSSSSSSQSSTSSVPQSSTPPPGTTPTPTPPNNTNDDDNDNDTIRRSVFNYYFLIIAAAIILLGVGIVYLRSRKRRKAAFIRSSSQRALARDVEGFRGRFGLSGGAFGIGGGAYRAGPRTRTRGDTEEGLDERGEAPPPYVEGTKPPSLRDVEGVVSVEHPPNADVQFPAANGQREAIELQNIERGTVNDPPSYDEHSSDSPAGPTTIVENDIQRHLSGEPPPTPDDIQNNIVTGGTAGSTEITRPPAAVTTSERST